MLYVGKEITDSLITVDNAMTAGQLPVPFEHTGELIALKIKSLHVTPPLGVMLNLFTAHSAGNTLAQRKQTVSTVCQHVADVKTCCSLVLWFQDLLFAILLAHILPRKVLQAR